MVPGLVRYPGEENGYPLQYSGLESSMDCTVHGGHKELDMTERLSLAHLYIIYCIKCMLKTTEVKG